MDIATAISRLQAGDCGEPWAFLYLAFLSDARKLANFYLHDVEEAEDVTQDVFARLPSRIRQYDPARGDFKAWLITSVGNAAKRRRKKMYSFSRLPRPVRESYNPEPRHILYEGIARLAPTERAVLDEHLDGHRNREIAAHQGITARSAGRQLKKAIKHLKQEMR